MLLMVSFHADGEYIASCSDDGTVVIGNRCDDDGTVVISVLKCFREVRRSEGIVKLEDWCQQSIQQELQTP